MASVIGSLIEKTDPRPGAEETVIVPFMRSMFVSTTSRPTPRPERSVIMPFVEKPGRKTRPSTCWSVISASSASLAKPRRSARARTRARSMPAPSSSISMTTERRLLRGRKPQAAGRALAGALPVLGLFDAVVQRVAQQVGQRVLELLDDLLVELRLAALDDKLDLLALLPGDVAQQPREQVEQRREREHAHAVDRILEFAGHQGHAQGVLVEGGGQVANVVLEAPDALADLPDDPGVPALAPRAA